MSKYIDAEKLIERLEEMKRAEYENCGGVNSKTGALQEVQELITSLQQEQPKKSAKNCKDCPHCVDLKAQDGWHFKGCFGGSYKGKWIAEIDECPLKQKQTEVDLEKEIERIIKNEDRFMKFQVKEQLIKYVARHFAEWGATHLDKKEKSKK